MNEGKGSESSLSRRSFLSQTVAAAALVSTADPKILAGVQTPEVVGRLRESFDFGWKFFKGDMPGAHQPSFSDAYWRNLDLPHDWSIEGPYGEKEPAAGPGGYLPTGIGWYRKHFRLPAAHKDQKILVHFDGIYENSEIWINGQFLGKRPFGYISFWHNLTPHLSFSGDNLLAVRVDNSRQPNSRWYSGSGIYRHTWLLTLHPVHIAPWQIAVTTPRISKDSATVQIKARIRNDQRITAACTLAGSLLDREGRVVATAEATQEIAAAGEYEFLQQVKVDQPHLWSVDDPFLYKLRSTVRIGQQIVDETQTAFGIREAVFDADRGFLLNGEPVKLNGACLHHDGGAVGAAVPERVWERRLGLLKEMGCNAIRTSHNPAAPEFLDLCDQMGFLVMNEAFDEWKVPKGQIGPYGYSLYFNEWHERDVRDFIHRDRNHPSVILWSAGNEIGDQTHPQGVQTLRGLMELFHREDPTRLVTVGCDQIAAEPKSAPQEFLALLDVVGYNYVDRWRDRAEKYYSIDRQLYPQRRVIGTESPGMGGARGDYRGLLPGESAGARGFGRGMGRRLDVEQLWKFVRTYDYVAGDFMWVGIDYLGEARWPNKSASSGVLDTCGFKKDGYYFYQSQWTRKPMLHIFPHWNWKGREGQFLPVSCYTNCDTVELFLNGRSVGVKGYAFPRLGMEKRYGTFPPRALAARTTADLHLAWDVPYEPGTLKAVGTVEGKVAVETEITTTGTPSAIDLSTDRDTIVADRRDLAHVTVRILDDRGRPVPDADNEVSIQVEGEGRLIGVDSGDPASHEDYKGLRRKCFNGLCLALVQSTAHAGGIRVTAASPGLKSGVIAMTAKS